MFRSKRRQSTIRPAGAHRSRWSQSARSIVAKLAVTLAVALTCSTVGRSAMADGTAFPFPVGCQCGGPSRPYCHEICPNIIEGDCSAGNVGSKCGANDVGECWGGTPNCRPKDAGTSKTDAGAYILYCQVYENCAMDDEGGCSIAADESAARGAAGLPALFIVSGMLLLMVDRRRRRHRR
jgi:hypothetical protein